MRTSNRALTVLIALLVALVSPLPAPAAMANGNVTCSLPESNADALEILSNDYPGYWWDHANLTIAVKTAPNSPVEYTNAIHDAIDIWSDVLLECFDGQITLTNVTGSQPSAQRAADIVVHYIPRAGGVNFGGYAVCGARDCPNVMIRSHPPTAAPHDREPDPYEEMVWLALHEIGHALGLGHTTNLLESTDLMGYGWPDLGPAVLSQCDVDALAFVFAWVFEGSAPHPPAAGPYVCE